MMSPSTTSALAKAIVASDTSHGGITSASAAAATKARAPRKSARVRMSDLPRCGLGKQAIGPENEHQRHHRIDDEQFELGNEMHRRGPAQADDGRAEHRALDRAHAADGDDGEGEHDDLDADAERHRDLRGHHGAAERAEHGADDEGHGVDQPDIDAEHRRSLAVEDHHREQPAATTLAMATRPMS